MNQLEKLKEMYERNKKIKEMLDRGETLRKINETFNVSSGVPNYIKQNYEKVQKNILDSIEQYERYIFLYKSGYTVSQVAEMEGTTKQNISRSLNICGVSKKEGGVHKKKENYIKNIKYLNDEGYTIEEISKYLGLSIDKIKGYAYTEGIKLKTDDAKKVKQIRENVIKLRSEGMNQFDIAKKLDISQVYVSTILIEAGMRTYLSREDYIERDGNIYNDFEGGLSIKELSSKYDMSEINIYRILYKFAKGNTSKKQENIEKEDIEYNKEEINKDGKVEDGDGSN